MALEADRPEVLIRSVENPRSLLTLVLGSIFVKFALWTYLKSVDSKTFVIVAFRDASGAERSLLTYFVDLRGPALQYIQSVVKNGSWLWFSLGLFQSDPISSHESMRPCWVVGPILT